MDFHYDKDGLPIDLWEWARRAEDGEYKRVALEQFDGGCAVSTVWLGINLNFHPDGPPLIFETMIFGGPLNNEQWRYSTLDQARAGHEAAVALVLASLAERN